MVDPSESMRIGVRLRQHRRRANVTQSVLAKATSVERSLVSRWEAGSREPSIRQIIQSARTLGTPVGLLVTGRSELQGGSQIAWNELVLRGLPLQFFDDMPLWAVRPIEETITDALVAPNPRIVDRLPGVLLARRFRPRTLWGACQDVGVGRRLGWLADLASTLARRGASAPPTGLKVILEITDRPARDASWDTLGFPVERHALLPPVSKRWRISYAQTLAAFALHADDLLATLEEEP